jgi:hypothetical protein
MSILTQAELQSVTGGWDWARTGRAASTGLTLPFNADVGAGRRLGGTPGAYLGGAFGVVSTPLMGSLLSAESAAYDAIEQAHGQPELKIDNANLRAGGPG